MRTAPRTQNRSAEMREHGVTRMWDTSAEWWRAELQPPKGPRAPAQTGTKTPRNTGQTTRFTSSPRKKGLMRRIRDQNGTWALVSCRWPPLASWCPVSVQRVFPLLGPETWSPSMSCSCHLVRRAPRWSSELPPADPSVVVPMLSMMFGVADSFSQGCSMSMDCRGGAGEGDCSSAATDLETQDLSEPMEQ